MRVFLDSNVLFSGSYRQEGPPGSVLDAAVAGRFTPVVSPFVLRETLRNLQTKAPHALNRYVLFLARANFEVVAEAPRVDIDALAQSGFESDASVVAAALAAAVEGFCSGDRRLRERLRSLDGGLEVFTPAELASRLQLN